MSMPPSVLAMIDRTRRRAVQQHRQVELLAESPARERPAACSPACLRGQFAWSPGRCPASPWRIHKPPPPSCTVSPRPLKPFLKVPFASAPGMDLGLDDNQGGAFLEEFFGDFLAPPRVCRKLRRGHGDAVFGQELLGLEFVNFMFADRRLARARFVGPAPQKTPNDGVTRRAGQTFHPHSRPSHCRSRIGA